MNWAFSVFASLETISSCISNKSAIGLVEPLGPQAMARFGADQLNVQPEPVATTLHRAFEHVADVQLAPDLLDVYGFALECERSVAGYDERAADARKIRRQALGHAIDEIVLLWIATEVRERQNHDGQAWR